MTKALLISIGNELLSGKTINTNASFLAEKITKLGFIVKKIITIPDEEDIVVKEISQAILEADFRLILITGGLGPTWDDSTASYLAKSLNLGIMLNDKALSIVTQRYNELYEKNLVDSPDITPARKKMALIPISSEPIYNPVGTAPGIFLNHKETKTWIICFPGVPREMKEMFNIIETRLGSLANENKTSYFEIEFTTSFTDESLIAPFLEKVRKKYDVWIKSLPKAYQEKKNIQLIISKSSRFEKEAKAEVLEAKAYLQKLIDSI